MSSRPSYFLFTKWTKGEAVEKSERRQKKQPDQPSVQGDECDDGGQWYNGGASSDQTYLIGQDAAASGFTRQANKRDAFNEMLGHRDMHTQVGQNPFLAGESYLNHLKIQEDYLRPQNTAILDAKMNS